LGKTNDNPAKDCKDVLDNGPGKESGRFYLQPNSQKDVK
jgi:hypothetical protein